MQSATEIDQLWRPSQWTNAYYFVVGGVALVIGIVVAFMGMGGGIPWAEKMAHGVWAGGLMLILWKYLEIRCTRYQLSAEQLTATHGDGWLGSRATPAQATARALGLERSHLYKKAKALGLTAQDYRTDKVESVDKLYSGKRIPENVPSDLIDAFYQERRILPRDEVDLEVHGCSRLVLAHDSPFEGMGHDIPPRLGKPLADIVLKHLLLNTNRNVYS